MRLYLSLRTNAGHLAEAHRRALAHTPPRRVRWLLSYWYYRDVDLDAMLADTYAQPYPKLFADSGAYSAFTHGETLDVQAYADWLYRWRHLFTAYANLDVMGDVRATLRNQRMLEQRGLTPLPVFHGGEPWSVLDDLVAEYRYIALGGLAASKASQDERMRWLVRAFRTAEGRAVYHGFGVTAWRMLKAFPWYSVDSTSWAQGFLYGSAPIFNARTGQFLKADIGDHARWYRLAPLVRAYGFDPAVFASRARYHFSYTAALSALSYMEAEAWLERRWGAVSIPACNTPPSAPACAPLPEPPEEDNRHGQPSRAPAPHQRPRQQPVRRPARSAKRNT